MLKVKNVSNNHQLEVIVKRINDVLENNQDFWKEVISHSDTFYLGDINGLMLHRMFHESNIVSQVGTFRSKNPWTKSNGYTLPKYPNKMWLNTRKFNRSEASIGATISHELIHNLDATQPKYSFGHGDNTYTPEKDACAPQWFGDLMYKYLSGGIASKQLDHAEKFIV